MKKLVFALMAGAALSASAQDTSKPRVHIKGTVIYAPIRNTPRPVAATVQQSSVQGSLPRAARLDQPLQMVNPVAPREYGNGLENINGYDDDPGQGPKNQKNYATAFKLFSLEF